MAQERSGDMSTFEKVCVSIIVVSVILLVAMWIASVACADEATIMSWNIRGYPEKSVEREAYVAETIRDLSPDVMCIQEIAGATQADIFSKRYAKRYVSGETDDGQDNAIFFAADSFGPYMPSLLFPPIAEEYWSRRNRVLYLMQSFQHPATAAHVKIGGFDAVVITVHLSWTDKVLREDEQKLLGILYRAALKMDPDVVICGDFNLGWLDMVALTANEMEEAVICEPANSRLGTTWAGSHYDWFVISPDCASEEYVDTWIVDSDSAVAREVSDHRPILAKFRTDEEFTDTKVQ